MRLIILCFLVVLPELVIGQDAKLRNSTEQNVVIRTSCSLGTVSEPPLFVVDGVVVEDISYLKGEGEHIIRLLDMSGKVCMVKTIKAIKGNNHAVLQLDTRLAAGIYVISITNKENKKPYTQKLLIQ